MIGLPVINNTADCRTFSNQVDLPKPNTSATEVIITKEADVIDPENTSNNHGSRPGITSKITEGTQTDSRGSDSGNGLPDCFPEHSKSSKSAYRAWKEYLQEYNSDPCQDGQVPACKNEPVDGHLSPYTIAPQRPLTPQADLYHGQRPSAFGMEFGEPLTCCAASRRPAPTRNSFEDHKHRMLMDWLERKN